MALRQTEGLIVSIVRRLGLDLLVPDHFTIGHRAKTVSLPARSPATCMPMLRFHTAKAQAIEIAMAVEVFNRMLDARTPFASRKHRYKR
jgi:hypothetical protein